VRGGGGSMSTTSRSPGAMCMERSGRGMGAKRAGRLQNKSLQSGCFRWILEALIADIHLVVHYWECLRVLGRKRAGVDGGS